MKFLAVFVAVLAVSAAAPRHAGWTAEELGAAINDPSTDPELVPHLIGALNHLMQQMWEGSPITTIPVVAPAGIIPAPSHVTPGGAVEPIPVFETPAEGWTVNELTEAINDPNTDPELVPHLVGALNHLMQMIWEGSPVTTIPVVAPAGIIPAPSHVTPGGAVEPIPVFETPAEGWTINELTEAINDPNTDPELVPHLVGALNHLMQMIWEGSPVTTIPVVAPAGIIPAPSQTPLEPVAPGEVVEEVIVPAPVAPVAPTPVAPTPVAPAPVAEAAASSPLVQLIVNVNVAQSAAEASPVAPAVVGESVVPTPVVAPTPVTVVDQPQIVSPVTVVDQPQVVSPVVVVDQPAVEPVVVVDQPAVAPVVVIDHPANPADVIAVAAPEVNPVDIISPVPAVVGGQDTGILV